MTRGQPVHCVQRRAVGPLLLSWTEYRSGSRLAAHAHGNPRLVFVLDGRFSETRDGRQRTCEPRTLLVRPAGELHGEDFCYGSAVCLSVDAPRAWIDRAGMDANTLGGSRQLQGAGIARIAAKLRREMGHNDTASGLAIEAALLEAWVEILRIPSARPESRRPAWLVRVVEILHARCTEPILLSSVARTVGVHPVHVARTFRRHCGTSIGEYVRILRVEHARQALSTSDEPLAAIAHRLGFSDQSHFCHAFKRLTGRTPSQFRAECRRR